MATGNYDYWKMPEGLLLIDAWARNGLTCFLILKYWKMFEWCLKVKKVIILPA